MPAVARNPAIAAMELATLAGLAPGRVIGGIGHGVQEWMAQIGARQTSPVTALDEVITALRALLRGETVTTAGSFVQLDHVALERPPDPVPPVLAGVRRPAFARCRRTLRRRSRPGRDVRSRRRPRRARHRSARRTVRRGRLQRDVDRRRSSGRSPGDRRVDRRARHRRSTARHAGEPVPRRAGGARRGPWRGRRSTTSPTTGGRTSAPSAHETTSPRTSTHSARRERRPSPASFPRRPTPRWSSSIASSP